MRSRDNSGNAPKVGRFFLQDKEFAGQIILAGQDTCLRLWDKRYVPAHNIPEGCLTGVLQDDQKRVSLLGCPPATVGNFRSPNGGYGFAEVFPRFVLLGDQHLRPNDKAIVGIDLVIDDAFVLFDDFATFGHFLGNAEQFIVDIARADAEIVGYEIPIGPEPEIFYFSGKREIIRCKTAIGNLTVSHRPHSEFLTGPRGLHLYNTIGVTLEFEEPLLFDEAIWRAVTLRNYLGLLVGRVQNIERLQLAIQTAAQPCTIEVYWSTLPKRNADHEADLSPQSFDLLLNAIRQPEQFGDVTSRWFARNTEWQDTRGRFFDCFAKQRVFDADRVIAAANMFDILPATASPKDVELSKHLEKARDAARSQFIALPHSPERQSVLVELKKLGKPKLKHKIRHRAEIVMSSTPNRFPDLFLVADQAVDFRNHYVHGGKQNFDYTKNAFAEVFFASTLEFVFAASDLIECGWDLKAWLGRGGSLSHPFALYCYQYQDSLKMLKSAIASGSRGIAP